MEFINKRNGFVYKTENPILIDMYSKDENMEAKAEKSAEPPIVEKAKRTRKKASEE